MRFGVVTFYCPELSVQLGSRAGTITLQVAWQPQILGVGGAVVAPTVIWCNQSAEQGAAETQVLSGAVRLFRGRRARRCTDLSRMFPQ